MGMIFQGLTMDPEWLLSRSVYTLLIVAGSYLILRWYGNVIARLMGFLGRRRALSRGYSAMFR